MLIQLEESFQSMTAVFHLHGLQGSRTYNNFPEQTKLFITKAVVIILCDGQFSLISQMLPFQRRVEVLSSQ